jgi:hypothetical protein
MAPSLTRVEQSFLAQLQAIFDSTGKGPRPLKRSSYQFLLAYGWFYTPQPLPKKAAPGAVGECYNNALKLVLDDPGLMYIEGFAAGGDGLPIHHAWATDGTGRAIDITWATPGVIYVGVPFKAGWVSLMGLKYKGVGGLLDDWEHDWPLLRGLGDEPEKWLELKGRGAKKLT